MNLEALFEFLPYVVLLFLILMNRRDLEREARILTPEHRRDMDETFNRHRFIQYSALVVILAAVFPRAETFSTRLVLVLLQAGALAAWSLSAFVFGRRILLELGIPAAYRLAYTRDRLLLFLLLGYFTLHRVWDLYGTALL